MCVSLPNDLILALSTLASLVLLYFLLFVCLCFSVCLMFVYWVLFFVVVVWFCSCVILTDLECMLYCILVVFFVSAGLMFLYVFARVLFLVTFLCFQFFLCVSDSQIRVNDSH